MSNNIRIKQAEKIRTEKGLKQTKLELVRISRGLSQTELSIKSGVSLRMIQLYEQRRRDLDGARLSTILDLCVALGCNLPHILEDESTIKKLERVSNFEDVKFQAVLVDKYSQEKELYNFCFYNSKNELDKENIANSMIPEIHKLVLKLRYENEMTISEIANELGVSSSRVQQIIPNALRRMKKIKAKTLGIDYDPDDVEEL